jgi:Cu/Zn superoxide dismutase
MKFTQLTLVLFSGVFATPAEPTAAIAHIDSNGFKGTVRFTDNGEETEIELDFQNIPDIQGQSPYSWHIHEKPVDASGDCASTGGHLDPYGLNPGGKNADYKCDPNNKYATCETGDLSGKYGKVNPSQKTYKFSDDDIFLYGEEGIIGRSLVMHLGNSTRIVCANITPVSESINYRAWFLKGLITLLRASD